MVAVARSRRCKQCKIRRRKCDECWPTCGLCRQVGDICSGPPSTFSTFLSVEPGAKSHDLHSDHDESSNTSNTTGQITHNQDGRSCLEVVLQKPAPLGNGVLSRMKLRRQAFFTLPPIPAMSDHVTQGLVSILNAEPGTAGDVGLRAGWIHLLPARLVCDSSLWCAADTFIRCWTSSASRGEEAVDHITSADIRSYNRAIRSLRETLQDKQQAHSTETLAAVALIYLCEDEMGFSRGLPGNCHMSGLRALLETRGLPKAQDELEVRLGFEMLSNLFAYLIDLDGILFFDQPGWLECLQEALGPESTIDEQSRPSYQLCIYLAHWIRLATLTRALFNEPSVAAAEALAVDAEAVSHSLDAFESNNEHLFHSRMCEKPQDTEHNIPGCGAYEFDTWLNCEVLCLHAAATLAVTQIWCSALRVAGAATESLPRGKLSTMSKRVWMAMPYALQQPPLRRLVAATALILSMEQAERSNQLKLATTVKDLLGRRWPPALSLDGQVVAAVLVTCLRLTGRSSFESAP